MNTSFLAKKQEKLSWRYLQGFTILEMLMVAAAMIILIGLTLSIGVDALARQEVRSAAQELHAAVFRAKAMAVAQSGDSDWGVKFVSGDNIPSNIIIFRGSSFAERNAIFDEVVSVSNRVKATGGPEGSAIKEVVFKKLSGTILQPADYSQIYFYLENHRNYVRIVEVFGRASPIILSYQDFIDRYGYFPSVLESFCPQGYVLVPGDPLYGTEDFCVMRYEAKAVDNDSALIEENSDSFAYGAQHYLNDWHRYWKGDLTGALLFNYALDTGDIEDLYNARNNIAKGYVEVAQDLGATMVHATSRDSTTWYDESGNNLHGTLVNTPTWNASGGPGETLPGYFNFNGTSQRIEVGDNSLLRLQRLTTVWWERNGYEQNVAWAQVLGKGNDSYMVRGNWTSRPDRRRVDLRGNGVYTGAEAKDAISAGVWQMFAASWDGQAVRLYRLDAGVAEQIAIAPRSDNGMVDDGGMSFPSHWAGSSGQTRYRAVSIPESLPWSRIRQNSNTGYYGATEACQDVGARLISNKEWMTIARNIESVDFNWAGGEVGSGSLVRGNSDSPDPMDGFDPLFDINRRTHTLTNGQIVWDMAGNINSWTDEIVSEFVDQPNRSSDPASGTSIEWTEVDTYGAYTYDDWRPTNPAWNSDQGMGTYYPQNLTNRVVTRSGRWDSGTSAGIFGAGMSASAEISLSNSIGFRCTTDTLLDLKTYVEVAQDLGATMVHATSQDSTTWYDESGNNLHGTLVNTPTWNASGGPGNNLPGYFSFNGTNQRIEVGDDPLLRLQHLTLVWWERNGHEQNANYGTFIGKGDDSYFVRAGYLSTPYNRRLQLRGSGVSSAVVSDNAVSAGVWQMFAASWDGQTMRLYRLDEGVAEHIAVFSRTEALEENADPFGYGAQFYEGSWRRYWKGDLAGISVFDRFLSESELESLHESSLGLQW